MARNSFIQLAHYYNRAFDGKADCIIMEEYSTILYIERDIAIV